MLPKSKSYNRKGYSNPGTNEEGSTPKGRILTIKGKSRIWTTHCWFGMKFNFPQFSARTIGRALVVVSSFLKSGTCDFAVIYHGSVHVPQRLDLFLSGTTRILLESPVSKILSMKKKQTSNRAHFSGVNQKWRGCRTFPPNNNGPY